MTCRERLAKEHPDMISGNSMGGCVGCPQDYGYRERAEWCYDTRYPKHERCDRCWSRDCLKHATKTWIPKQDAEFVEYTQADVAITQKLYEISRTHYGYLPAIKKVIFNDPATIVYWTDDTKTVVKVKEGDTFDPEKGLAMAVCEKAFGSKSNSHKIFKKWLPEEKPELPSPVTKALHNLSKAMANLNIPKLNVSIKEKKDE